MLRGNRRFSLKLAIFSTCTNNTKAEKNTFMRKNLCGFGSDDILRYWNFVKSILMLV